MATALQLARLISAAETDRACPAHPRSAIKRSAAAEPQQEQHEARPSKRARKAAAGPFQLATDARGAAEQERLEGIRRQQEEQARAEAEFKVRVGGGVQGAHGLQAGVLLGVMVLALAQQPAPACSFGCS